MANQDIALILQILKKAAYVEDASADLIKLEQQLAGSNSESGVGTMLPTPSLLPNFATGVWKQSDTLSRISAKTFEHGLGGQPDIIVVVSNYKTRYKSDYNPKSITGSSAATVVGGVFIKNAIREYHTVPATYSGTGQCGVASMGISGKSSDTAEGYICIPSVDGVASETTFTINLSANKRGGAGLTYRWYALRFDGSEFNVEG